MRSPSYLSASLLGLSAGLSAALQPIFSTVSDPFSLTAADIQRFNVTLEFNATLNAFVPLLSLDPSDASLFILTDGNLTTPDGAQAAFFGNVTDVIPSPLLPLLFGKGRGVTPFESTADFVQQNSFSGSQGFRPQLLSLNGGGFI